MRDVLAWPGEEIRLRREDGANAAACAPPLIRTAFGKSEEIDDGTSVQDVPSSISPRPPGRLEWNARGRW